MVACKMIKTLKYLARYKLQHLHSYSCYVIFTVVYTLRQDADENLDLHCSRGGVCLCGQVCVCVLYCKCVYGKMTVPYSTYLSGVELGWE